jgi:hypothetical protein
LFVLSGPPSPANIREGSSPALLKGYKPAVDILQEHFPANTSVEYLPKLCTSVRLFSGFENEK